MKLRPYCSCITLRLYSRRSNLFFVIICICENVDNLYQTGRKVSLRSVFTHLNDMLRLYNGVILFRFTIQMHSSALCVVAHKLMTIKLQTVFNLKKKTKLGTNMSQMTHGKVHN